MNSVVNTEGDSCMSSSHELSQSNECPTLVVAAMAMETNTE